MSDDPKVDPTIRKQSVGSFWLTAATMAAPLYYLIIVRPERDDEVSTFGWILGYFVFVFLAAWLLYLAKLVLGSKLGRLAVLAYISIAFVFLFAIPFVTGRMSFRDGGAGAELVALITLVGGFLILFQSWGEEIKK